VRYPVAYLRTVGMARGTANVSLANGDVRLLIYALPDSAGAFAVLTLPKTATVFPTCADYDHGTNMKPGETWTGSFEDEPHFPGCKLKVYEYKEGLDPFAAANPSPVFEVMGSSGAYGSTLYSNLFCLGRATSK